MAPTTLQTIFGLWTILGAIVDSSSAAPQPAQPKVWGLDFSKRVARNTPETNRLRRRAKSLTVAIDNDEIECADAYLPLVRPR